ncbi:signal peptidase I [Anatilimnocola sp. NA78]|uniref:signal peptidase I n=1 Tax=Anatilimnocola sp. NA78 TaxID=3415683 RepID=UPI003CE453EE
MSTASQIGNSIVSQASALSLTGEPIDLEALRMKQIRRAILALLGLLVFFVAARLWCLEGLLFPVRVTGASMGTTLSGEHYRVKCDDCQVEFRCDARNVPMSHEVVCPHCGYRHNQLQPSDYQPGDQVLIDRWVYLLGRPRRGELVAFPDPNENSQRVVKRIVGMPGEQIAIRRGDVYVDGKPWRKSLAEMRAAAILVHDDHFPVTKTRDAPGHWQPAAGEKSHWVEREHAFIHSGKVPPLGKNSDWLSFHNWRMGYTPETRTTYSTVLDNDSYNQNLDRTSLNAVPDLLLTCRASIAKYACLVFAAVDGNDRFEVHMCHDIQKLKLFQNGQEIDVKLLPHRDYEEPIDIEFALCDQQVLFGMDGREVLRQPYERKESGTFQAEPQLEIGGAGARIRISKLKVYRDLYYLEPGNTGASWHAERPIPANHYFALGDNPPASSDSREWVQAEVPLGKIQGRVMKPFWIR